MPGPMPPQAAPQPGQAPDAGGAPQEGGGANQLAEFIGNISEGLTKLVDVVGSSGNAEAAKGLDQITQQFQQIMQSVMSGGEEQGQPPQGQGMASPEAGGAQGAVPASMQR